MVPVRGKRSIQRCFKSLCGSIHVVGKISKHLHPVGLHHGILEHYFLRYRFSVKDELFDMEAVSKIFKVDIDIVNEDDSRSKDIDKEMDKAYLVIDSERMCCPCSILQVKYHQRWNYNPNKGGELKSTKLDNFTPRIVDRKDDYVRVEYESPILGFVDDVEFWFPPGKKPLVQYRSASCIGLGFDANKKRVKVKIVYPLFSERSMNAIIVWAFRILSSLFIACNTSAEIIEPFQLAT
ncbi:putative reverse transcriptase domain-containing protein [Tanacetum coccineum]|uniref:Reverse transcriptase domain-containing protein n=1 Tax=Tanacetum coccineum TaxID=301880 RepID=A0ABQ5FIB6_9ASTR